MTAQDIVEFIIRNGDQWCGRVDDDSANRVETGSPLDDSVLLPGDVSLAQMVWRLIADGGTHIAAHHLWMEGTNYGMWLKPSTTLGRTAAVCASRALHVMDGSTFGDRRVRALQLMNDDADGLVKIAGDARRRQEPNAQPLVNEAAEYKRQIGDMLETAGKNRGSAMDDTTLLSNAAGYFPGKEDQAMKQLQMMWRFSSATAHGRSFTWDTGLEDRPIDDQLVSAWSMPAQLLETTWEKWLEMRISP